MVPIKSPSEIEIMKKGGAILHKVLEGVLGETRVGMTLNKLDILAEELIRREGGEPSFKKVKGYRWTICVCINDVVVHGIPADYVIKNGDVVGIDCGVYYQGHHTDSAWTIQLGKNKEIERFLSTGKTALENSIAKVAPGNHIFDISKAIQDTVEKGGYSVVRTLVGHGVGKNLHEDPEVPCFVSRKRENTVRLTQGMVLAIEVIYNMGKEKVVYKGKDGWTIVTRDGKISGLFEATVAVTSRGCLVLTPIVNRE